MFGGEGKCLVDAPPEIGKSLRGQRVHEVEANVVKPRRACRTKCRARLLCRVDAPDGAQEAVVKALHAEAEAVHARIFELPEIRLVHRTGVHLNRAFKGLPCRLVDGIKNLCEKRGGQCGRGAAAEVDGRDIAPARTKRRRFAQNLRPQRRRIVLHLR